VHRISIDPLRPSPTALALAAALIRDGGLVAFPTDTLYGLGADPRLPDAVDAVYRAKGRTGSRALPLVASSVEQVEMVGRLTPLASRLAGSLWPGPLTVLIAALPVVPASIHGGSGRVAVRVPDHAVARGLAHALGHPIISTSANRTGTPAASTPDEVAASLGDVIGLLLDAGATPGGLPSTIVDASGAEPRLVRVGAVAWARVLESVAG